jgi:hypothetical protein
MLLSVVLSVIALIGALQVIKMLRRLASVDRLTAKCDARN